MITRRVIKYDYTSNSFYTSELRIFCVHNLNYQEYIIPFRDVLAVAIASDYLAVASAVHPRPHCQVHPRLLKKFILLYKVLRIITILLRNTGHVKTYLPRTGC